VSNKTLLLSDFLGAESAVYRHPEWAVDLLVAPSVDISEAVLVTGFWRSGTTWLQQSLARIHDAKTVFEPLHPSLKTYGRCLRNERFLPKYDREYLNLHIPFVKKGMLRCSRIGEYIRLALKGVLPGLHVRNARPERNARSRIERVIDRARGAVQTRVVAKFVRAHFLIEDIHRLFRPAVMVHIRRDPRSIIASMRREDWLRYWAGTLSLEDQLIRPRDGRSEYFERWHDDIRAIERRGTVARWAAYWALTERFVSEIEEHERRIVLRYETLATEGAAYLSEKMCPPLSSDISPEALQKDSATTSSRREGASTEERVRGWTRTLEEEEVREIEQIVAHFDMDEHLYA
jgi:hypothetical protein